MGIKKLRACGHRILKKRCPSCRALQAKWYRKLEQAGFHDIEYGLDNARFLAHVPDPTAPGSEQAQGYYERVWQVFHAWSSSGRPRRDCRVAELLAAQQGDTGTVRGIARTLKAERLHPYRTESILKTLKEIETLVHAAAAESSIDSLVYLETGHKAA